MTTLAQRIVVAAMTYIGTPWKHQGQLRGYGIDCAHFVANVINEARASSPPIEIPHNYRPQEDGKLMSALLGANAEFIAIEDRQAGDVLALCDEAIREPDAPRHLAFVKEVTATTTFIIHAGAGGVVCHRMNAAWNRRIHSVWRAHE